MSLVPPHVGISHVTRATARRHLNIVIMERLKPHAMLHICSRGWSTQPLPLSAWSTRCGRSNSPSEASVAADAPAPWASESHSPPPPPPLSDRDLRHRLNAQSAAPAPAQTGVRAEVLQRFHERGDPDETGMSHIMSRGLAPDAVRYLHQRGMLTGISGGAQRSTEATAGSGRSEASVAANELLDSLQSPAVRAPSPTRPRAQFRSPTPSRAEAAPTAADGWQQRTVCKFWERGSCRDGDNCKFLHVANTRGNADVSERRGERQRERSRSASPIRSRTPSPSRAAVATAASLALAQAPSAVAGYILDNMGCASPMELPLIGDPPSFPREFELERLGTNFPWPWFSHFFLGEHHGHCREAAASFGLAACSVDQVGLDQAGSYLDFGPSRLRIEGVAAALVR